MKKLSKISKSRNDWLARFWLQGMITSRCGQSLSCVQLFSTPWTVAHQVPLSSTISQSSLELMSLSQWCHPTISSAFDCFFSCCQSFPVSGSFPVSQLFTSGSQRIGALASASVLPINIQGWFPLRLTGLISLLSKGLSRVFFSTTVWKHQFFGLSLHNRTWLLEKP